MVRVATGSGYFSSHYGGVRRYLMWCGISNGYTSIVVN